MTADPSIAAIRCETCGQRLIDGKCLACVSRARAVPAFTWRQATVEELARAKTGRVRHSQYRQMIEAAKSAPVYVDPGARNVRSLRREIYRVAAVAGLKVRTTKVPKTSGFVVEVVA